ncbi:MAG: 23S rRNA pseudouridine synthase F, partial [bacterium (Candidatus Stahlbacteria) CG23_combo_of_CG06-09_8_20_14_all_40_9]
MRLNKFLSEAGIASRRKADEIISEKRVKVNGIVADIGTTINS